MSNFENPYQPPNAPNQSYDPNTSTKVKVPAIALIVLGVLGIMFLIFDFVSRMINISNGTVMVIGDQPGAAEGAMIGAWIGAGVDVIAVICQVVVIMGAVGMLKMKNHGLAKTACIISLVPCISACCVVGIPFGIWGLVVLNDPVVKSAFRD